MAQDDASSAPRDDRPKQPVSTSQLSGQDNKQSLQILAATPLLPSQDTPHVVEQDPPPSSSDSSPQHVPEEDSPRKAGGLHLRFETESFPQLTNDPPNLEAPSQSIDAEKAGEEPPIANSFDRTISPTSALSRNRGAGYEKVGEEGVCKMHKFSLYETATRYYVVGGDILDRRFRILKIDRTADSGDLSIAEDDIIYTKKEMKQLLNAVDDGNKSTGGMKLKCSTWAILGFIRFTGCWYMMLITKRSQVAMIGGHYIYQVDGTELVPLTTATGSRSKSDRNAEEARFLSIFNNLDLSRSFYFSYSYDITRTLQHNMLRERQALRDGLSHPAHADLNAMFVWNHYLLEPALDTLKLTFDWCLPIIHGFVDQASIRSSLNGYCKR